MTIEIPDDWYEKTANVQVLCHYLKVVRDYGVEDILRVLDDPRGWRPEYAAAVVLFQSQEC